MNQQQPSSATGKSVIDIAVTNEQFEKIAAERGWSRRTTDTETRLFDLSPCVSFLQDELQRIIVQFVADFAGPFIATYGSQTRVCADTLLRSGEYLGSMTSRYDWAKKIVDSLHPKVPMSKRTGFRGEYAILIDALSDRYASRQTGSKEKTTVSAPTTTTAVTGKEPLFAAAVAHPLSTESMCTHGTYGAFFSAFLAWLKSAPGRAELVRHTAGAVPGTRVFVYRHAAYDSWEWNAKLLSHSLLPAALRGHGCMKKDLGVALQVATKVLAEEGRKRATISSPKQATITTTTRDGDDVPGARPPMPLLHGDVYIAESLLLNSGAPITAHLLRFLRMSGYTRTATVSVTAKHADSKTKRNGDNRRSSSSSSSASVSSSSSSSDDEEDEEEEGEDPDHDDNDDGTRVLEPAADKRPAVMGIAQPTVKTDNVIPTSKTTTDTVAVAAYTRLGARLYQYFENAPHLQMDCRMVSAMSKDGQGFGGYMFDKSQISALCASVKATHSLGLFDATCESDYRRWHSRGFAKRDSAAPPPQRTHSRQDIFTLAQQLSSMVTHMEATDRRLYRFQQYSQQAARSETMWPKDSVLTVPWFEASTRAGTVSNLTSVAGEVRAPTSIKVGDYYDAWRADKTGKWIRFLRAAKTRLWEMYQSAAFIPYGSLEESDPEIALLLALHRKQHFWGTPLQAHASIFKMEAWMGIPELTVHKLVDHLNTAVNTIVVQSDPETHLKSAAEWQAARNMVPINLCFPLCDGSAPIGHNTQDMVKRLSPRVCVGRLREMIASSVALLGAVYKFLLYVSTISHKILVCEGLSAMPRGSLQNFYERVDHGLGSIELVLKKAVDGDKRACDVQDKPRHVVYGHGEFGPVTTADPPAPRTPTRPRKARSTEPSKTRATPPSPPDLTRVSTVDPIHLLQLVATMEGRPQASTHSWGRLMLLSRFPGGDVSDDRSGNEDIAMTTQFMEDLMNCTAFRMMSDGWRLDMGVSSARLRAERRRIPLSLCHTLLALVKCVRACVHGPLQRHMTDNLGNLRAQMAESTTVLESALTPEQVTDIRMMFADDVWAERVTRALVVAQTMVKFRRCREARVIRGHVYAATKAWWPMGLIMCTTPSNTTATMRAFTETRSVIIDCIARCVRAHIA